MFVTFGALAVERVDLVHAFPIVEARLRCAVISVYLTEHTFVTCTHEHAQSDTCNFFVANAMMLILRPVKRHIPGMQMQ